MLDHSTDGAAPPSSEWPAISQANGKADLSNDHTVKQMVWKLDIDVLINKSYSVIFVITLL